MSKRTYYVVQPYERSKKGRLMAGTPVNSQGPEQAKRLAERLAQRKAGAIAFSRSGDPEAGEFDDAVVLGVFGTVPDDVTAPA